MCRKTRDFEQRVGGKCRKETSTVVRRMCKNIDDSVEENGNGDISES